MCKVLSLSLCNTYASNLINRVFVVICSSFWFFCFCKQAFGCSVERLHLFFRCAVTNHINLGGFKQYTFIFWLFWRLEVRINISAGVSSDYELESRCKPPCKGFRGASTSCLSQLLSSVSPLLVVRHSNLCLFFHTASSPSRCVRPSSASLLQTLLIGFRAHPIV